MASPAPNSKIGARMGNGQLGYISGEDLFFMQTGGNIWPPKSPGELSFQHPFGVFRCLFSRSDELAYMMKGRNDAGCAEPVQIVGEAPAHSTLRRPSSQRMRSRLAESTAIQLNVLKPSNPTSPAPAIASCRQRPSRTGTSSGRGSKISRRPWGPPTHYLYKPLLAYPGWGWVQSTPESP